MPYVNSCKSLNIIVMELVNISKDNHCHWGYFYKWTSSVAFILEEYLLFLLGMLTHMWEVCQPLMAIMFMFYMKNINDSWWGTLKKGLPIISWYITIYDFYFCAKFKPSWMIKNVYKTSVLNGIMCLILMYPGQVLGGTWPSQRLLFTWGYPKKILLKISGQNLLFWMSYKDSY